MRTGTTIRATLLFAAIMAAASWGEWRMAPDWRSGTGPVADDDRGVKLLPPMRLAAKGVMVRTVVDFQKGTDDGVDESRDGARTYREGTPAQVQIGWMAGGQVRRDEDGSYAGVWIPVPRGCEGGAKAMVGHALFVPRLVWRMPDGRLRTTTKGTAISAMMCTARPNAVLDTRRMAESPTARGD